MERFESEDVFGFRLFDMFSFEAGVAVVGVPEADGFAAEAFRVAVPFGVLGVVGHSWFF